MKLIALVILVFISTAHAQVYGDWEQQLYVQKPQHVIVDNPGFNESLLRDDDRDYRRDSPREGSLEAIQESNDRMNNYLEKQRARDDAQMKQRMDFLNSK